MTDSSFEEWMARTLQQDLLNETFFLNAMEEMVERIGNLGQEEVLIFVVASDDPEWCREKFSQFKLDHPIVYTVDHHPHVLQRYCEALNWVGCSNRRQVDQEYVYFDLAVLSSVDYSIFDYGTFGLWGAYLSQSRIVIGADLKATEEQSKHLGKDKVVKAGIEGFVFLPTFK